MTDADMLRHLLSNLEAALEDHSYALHTAHRAAGDGGRQSDAGHASIVHES